MVRLVGGFKPRLDVIADDKKALCRSCKKLVNKEEALKREEDGYFYCPNCYKIIITPPK
jgi:formamidopyrimidine-DNA glycosylase